MSLLVQPPPRRLSTACACAILLSWGASIAAAPVPVKSLGRRALAQSLCSCPAECTPSAETGTSDNTRPFLVKFSPAAAAQGRDILLKEKPGLIKQAQPIEAEPTDLWVITLSDPASGWKAVRNLTGVQRVEPTALLHSQSGSTPPDDPKFTDQWYLNAAELNAVAAWSKGLDWKMRPMTIVVADSGVAQRADLAGRIGPGVNFVGPTSGDQLIPPADADVADESGHGTAMAGIIAAVGNNKTDVTGLMWGATILPCKMAAADTADLIGSIRCLRWAAAQRPVAVNFSYSMSQCSCVLEDEIRNLQHQGILLVAATAGDNTATNDAVVGGACPIYPAAHRVSNVIAVTAMDEDHHITKRAGKHSVHVAAPGDRIPVLWGKDEVKSIPGTSPATAEVTGLIALLKAQDPSRDWRKLRNLVIAGGVPLDNPSVETISNRRIRAYDSGKRGSMTCRDQLVQRRLSPVSDAPLKMGEPVVLKVLSIKCASPSPSSVPVVVTNAAGTKVASLSLNDNGQSPDEVAGDGEFAALWTPPQTPSPQTYTLKFWAPAIASETLIVNVGK